jgi:asparagine synthase (glutamine-hydrolysing)
MKSFCITIISSEIDTIDNRDVFDDDNHTINIGKARLIFHGDAIFSSSIVLKNNNIIQQIIDKIKGHFYYFYQDENGISFGNSAFSILPIFYHISGEKIIISNKVNLIKKVLNRTTKNKRFFLENVLFNYQLFNNTIYNEIQLLPSNSFLSIKKDKIEIKKIESIENYFIDRPSNWKKSIDHISEFFIDISKQYLPDEIFAVSVTGGFDSRTLTCLSKFYNKEFLSYSFGAENSSDLIVAKYLAEKGNLNFISFEADQRFIEKSLDFGLKFINGSEGRASFSRAHYMYSMLGLSEKVNYMITGNFGSEIFRAMHNTGVVVSSNLYALFTSKNYEDAIERIESSEEFKFLNKHNLNNEWNELKEDLRSFVSFNYIYDGLTKNQKFYKFAFEEIFRKYFGAEIENQFNYLINRTPFLDYDFVKEILKTQLSGVFSSFFSNNPLKRFKGQMVYANIISKTYPLFGAEYTNKGYRPDDLLSLKGKIRVSYNYLDKKIIKSNKFVENDSFGVVKSFKFNKNFWSNLDINGIIFNKQHIEKYFTSEKYNDLLFQVLSQAWYEKKS